MIVANTEHTFILDNVMFLESYRYTRNILGYIYLQKFPSGKLYAGQTINFYNRIKQYKRNKGNNDHHTNAFKKYNFTNVTVVYQQCPLYLLNIVETFLIEFYNLTNSMFGYNKTTGGRKGYTVSDETRAKLSLRQIGEKNHMFGIRGVKHHRFGKKFKKTPEQNAKTMGENNPMFGKRGELSPNFGRKKTEEELAKMSERMSGENNPMFGKKGELSPIYGENNGMFGKTGEQNPFFGKQHTVESRAKMSEKLAGENSPWFGRKHTKETRAKQSEKQKGEKNHSAKPVCVFGKLYGAGSVASDILRDVCDTKSNGNFIKSWVQRKSDVAFYVDKRFYDSMRAQDIQITREMYDNWVNSTV